MDLRTERLPRLAINEEGFIFDPATGESFTVNETGLKIVLGLKNGKSREDIKSEFCEEFEVSADNAEKDISDFIEHLRACELV